jgi:hypothetical protein
VELASLVPDRDVFAETKGVGSESVPGLDVMWRCFSVVKDPARVLWLPRFVQQIPDLLAVAPEPEHSAIFPILLPECNIDMGIGIQWRCEL